MAALRQKTVFAKLDTPAGADKLVLTAFECTEGMSELFEYKVDASTTDKSVDFDSMIGRNCTITYFTLAGDKRYFDGVLAKAEWLGKEIGLQKDAEGLNACQLVLRPWLWLLSFRSNCLIFHDKTAPQIIAEIFGKHGFAKFSDKTSRSYPQMEYCVQYRESDMAFVCRLMEQHGISYYFEHSDGEHKLILADEMSTFKTIPGGSRSYIPSAPQHFSKKEAFEGWTYERKFTSGKVKLKDYDFKKPSAEMKADKTGDAEYENGKLEIYDYPGKYVERSDGMDYATVRLNIERGSDGHFHATGNCVSAFPGCLVTLEKHPDSDQNKEYLVLNCVHSFEDQSYRSSSSVTSGEVYKGKYELVKSDKTWAPPIVTERPYIRGPQTAEVVGDGEIHVDKYGRIKVRFHWDDKSDQSMWCRVAQVWSGKQWGGVFIPRVGMEAVVQFLEGDPDQPLVIGTVYNNEYMPPYTLPDDKTIAGIKSNSSTGGNGYNEFIFDDKAGKELVRLHAQKDLKSVIEKTEARDVGTDRTTSVGDNDTLHVGKELKIDAGTLVEITVGESKITMTTSQITIESLTIEIKAKSLKSSAVTSEHSASGIMDIQGTIVKIN